MAKILAVDDELAILEMIESILNKDGHLVTKSGTNKHLSAAWKLRYDIFQCQSPKLLEHVTQRPANIIWIKCAVW